MPVGERRPLILIPMRRLRLSTLLVGVNVSLLLLVLGAVASSAVWLLLQLSADQALARVAQLGVIARQQVDSTGQGVLNSAQLLSEHPTLHRLLAQEETATLPRFLGRFQDTSQLDGAAVLEGHQVVAQSGAPLPWTKLASVGRPHQMYGLYRFDTTSPLTIVAWMPVPTFVGKSVAVARVLDSTYARQLSTMVGLPITIVPREEVLGPGVPLVQEQHRVLRVRALSDNVPVTDHLDDLDSYVAVVPLQGASGEPVGIVETRLSAASVGHSLQWFVMTLLVLALGMGTLAAVVSIVLGRRLSRPLLRLSRAAMRIGSGDLQTPVRATASAEIGTLAGTLEEMRRRLLQLTDDLRRKQAEAEAILAGIVEGVFSVDSARRIRYLNPQAAAMLGISSEAALGRFCGDVLQPQGRDGVRPCEDHCPIVHARFRRGAQATEHLLLPNGERRTVVITSAPPTDEVQVQVLRDETEIEATRRLRDAILANISHEFKTPLSAQLASIELLLDQLPTLHINQIASLVVSQQRGTLRLMQLIDNLLESARIEAGQDRIRRQPVALDEVVEEALELTRPLLAQRQQAVVFELPYPLPSVCGDARRLTQVFVNLLGNANKFAPAGSTIEIGGTVGTTSLTIWVEDQGPGLPATPHQGMFKRFVRSSGDEPEQSGAGLGLSLVKSIVERHGGSVEAQTLATGTRMCIVLPVEEV
jgi:signal transduction histidine kinase